MSLDRRADEMTAEQRVARLFELAGYDVEQVVGIEPGTVDRYATPRAGLVRPRTYWRVWHQAPVDPEAMMTELVRARNARKADRALAILTSSGLPDGYETDLHGLLDNIITYRRLVLEISGIADQVRVHARRYKNGCGDEFYVPRSVRTNTGEVLGAIEYITEWAQKSSTDDLVLVGETFSGRTATIERARYELGMRFVSDPENIRPIAEFIDSAVAREAFRDQLVPLADSTRGSGRCVYRAALDDELPSDGLFERVELLPPDTREVEQWFRRHLKDKPSYDNFIAARKLDDFRRLSNAPANLDPLVGSINALGVTPHNLSAREWIIQVVVRYMNSVLAAAPPPQTYYPGTGALIQESGVLEDAALEQFALGRVSNGYLSRFFHEHPINYAPLSTWMAAERSRDDTPFDSVSNIRFSNQLIWDYFLARWIARAFRKGDTQIFARYQFPKEYVLLFLSVLAPEVAAQLTADRGEAVRAEIEAEVERRLQLTLGHLVKRSVGAIRMNLDAVRETISPEDAAKLRYELGRIDEELAFQSALAERTGRWQEVPNGPEERVALHEIVSSVLAPLTQKHAGVACHVDVDTALGVRARRSVLREILHCLVENAFHAVVFSGSPSPEIRVTARAEGETILVEILDSGPGIRAADHERIFEPYFTTKKGGDQPLGTGMGLSIARRYAERIGAVVGLDPERRPTCFFVRLVSWRDTR
jgi:signal transduction histidine kinase